MKDYRPAKKRVDVSVGESVRILRELQELSQSELSRCHKGQPARAGGYHKIGFEGGQMPLHRRLPKRGFKSLSRRFVVTVRLGDLERLQAEQIDLAVLKQAGLAPDLALSARIV